MINLLMDSIDVFFAVIIPVFFMLFIFISIGSAVSKAARLERERQAREAKNPTNPATNPARYSDINSIYGDSLKPLPNRPAVAPKSSTSSATQSRTATPAKVAPKPMTSRLTSNTSSHDDHSHPMDPNAKYRQEIVFTEDDTYSGEGCAEHYFTRFIKLDESNDAYNEHEEHDEHRMLRLMVFSDALLHRRGR